MFEICLSAGVNENLLFSGTYLAALRLTLGNFVIKYYKTRERDESGRVAGISVSQKEDEIMS